MAAVVEAEPASHKRLKATYVLSEDRKTGSNESRESDSSTYFSKSERVGKTDPQTSELAEAIILEHPPAPEKPMPQESRAVSANGSILQVLEDHIEVVCTIGGESVHIHLPKSLVPEDLHIYGTPVRLSLSDESGSRVPVLERREAEKMEMSAKEKDLFEWLEGKTR